jgi:hypothetical protein
MASVRFNPTARRTIHGRTKPFGRLAPWNPSSFCLLLFSLSHAAPSKPAPTVGEQAHGARVERHHSVANQLGFFLGRRKPEPVFFPHGASMTDAWSAVVET